MNNNYTDEQLKQLSLPGPKRDALKKAITANNDGSQPSVRSLTSKLDLLKAGIALGLDITQFVELQGARTSQDASEPSTSTQTTVEHRSISDIETDIGNAKKALEDAQATLAKVEAIEGLDPSVVDSSRAVVDAKANSLNDFADEHKSAVDAQKAVAQAKRSRQAVTAPTIADIDWQDAQKVFANRSKALKGVLVPVYVGNDQAVLDHVPSVDQNFFFNYENGELLRDVLISFGAVYKSGNPANSNAWLWGQRGAGKSDLVTQIAGRLNRPVFVTSCHRELTIEQLGGEFDPRSVAQGASAPVLLTPSFAQGISTKHAIVVLDEVGRVNPTNAVGFNGTLESRVLSRIDGTKVPFADGVTIAVTDNTDGTGDPSGQFEAYPQDQSFLDRFRAIIKVPFLPSDVEAKVLIAKEGINEPIAKLIVKLMNAFRGACEGAGGHNARGLYPSLRGAFALSYSLREGKGFRRAIDQHLVGSAIASDKQIAKVLIDSIAPTDDAVRDVLTGVSSDFTAEVEVEAN